MNLKLNIRDEISEQDFDNIKFADTSQASNSFKDLTGHFKAYIWVMGPAGRIKQHGGTVWTWYVHCFRCGRFVIRVGKVILRASTQTCGCLRLEWKKLPDGGGAYNNAYQRYVSKTKREGITIDMSKEKFIQMFKADCYYCGAPPALRKSYYGGKYGVKCSTVDRKHPILGYTLSNCVPCCVECNRMKGKLSDVEFIQQAKHIAKHLK
jgi:hypothetical protein